MTDYQIKETYKNWMSRPLPADLKAELESIAGDSEAVSDRFYRDLAFGTGGLRGVIGAGTNRMNIYTVGKATQGYADYLREQTAVEESPSVEESLSGEGLPSVVIAYDSRIKSEEFARRAAEVFAANGIRVHIYPELMPTPSLSFAIRHLGCDGGVVITASHNPAKYNGYKVYGPDGCQITTEAAKAIQGRIGALDLFEDVKRVDFDRAMKEGRISWVGEDVVDAYIRAVSTQRFCEDDEIDKNVSITYTPLNGAGLKCVLRALRENGFSNIHVVPEQEKPDGHFPTCPYPNPEIREAMELGIQYAKKNGSDLLLATDPDCDRVGIAVRDDCGEYVLLTGNEVGLLLFEYICRRRIACGRMPENPVLMKTIVTIDHVKKIADRYGVQVIDVLTGFKFIGEQIGLLEKKGELDRYIFGFEESYGYLSGTFVRDKDGVNASLLICEMFAYYKTQGKGLLGVLNDLYDRYGYCLNTQHSCQFEGAAGFERMQQIMSRLRQAPPKEAGGRKVISVEDYQTQEKRFSDGGMEAIQGLPRSNVLKFWLEGGCSFVVRPSGTEPKLKLYFSVSGEGREQVGELEQQLSAELMKYLGI